MYSKEARNETENKYTVENDDDNGIDNEGESCWQWLSGTRTDGMFLSFLTQTNLEDMDFFEQNITKLWFE